MQHAKTHLKGQITCNSVYICACAHFCVRVWGCAYVCVCMYVLIEFCCPTHSCVLLMSPRRPQHVSVVTMLRLLHETMCRSLRSLSFSLSILVSSSLSCSPPPSPHYPSSAQPSPLLSVSPHSAKAPTYTTLHPSEAQPLYLSS